MKMGTCILRTVTVLLMLDNSFVLSEPDCSEIDCAKCRPAIKFNKADCCIFCSANARKEMKQNTDTDNLVPRFGRNTYRKSTNEDILPASKTKTTNTRETKVPLIYTTTPMNQRSLSTKDSKARNKKENIFKEGDCLFVSRLFTLILVLLTYIIILLS